MNISHIYSSLEREMMMMMMIIIFSTFLTSFRHWYLDILKICSDLNKVRC